jgi:hypothetical protein
MAMAISDSVTVSIAAVSSGMFRPDILRQPSGNIHIPRKHGGFCGDEEHIVIRDRFADDLLHFHIDPFVLKHAKDAECILRIFEWVVKSCIH